MDYKIRLLELYDIGQYLKLLSQLSDVGKDWPHAKRKQVFEEINQNSNFQQIYVAVDINNKVIGAITVLLERKFLHNGAIAAHIEDVVVDESARGHGVGKSLVQFAVRVAKKADAYKVILNCDPKVKTFYESCKFTNSSNIEQLRLTL